MDIHTLELDWLPVKIKTHCPLSQPAETNIEAGVFLPILIRRV